MNNVLTRKLRKYASRRLREQLKYIKTWPFSNRLRLCWYLLFGREN